MAKRIFTLRLEYAPIGTSVRRKRFEKEIYGTPRNVMRVAAQAVREGRGEVANAVIVDGGIPVVRCNYSIYARSRSRHVPRGLARCFVDPIFKRELK